LAGLATSSQTVRSLLRNPLGSKAVWKKITQIEFGKFASVEECTQLLLIQHIQKSKKFNKPPYKQITKEKNSSGFL
jgi:hypothetical protein